MAYIIAHGTVNGYNKVYQPTDCGSEIQVITDIRAEFDNTSTMLEKPMGYLLQISPNGVWISVVKLLFDGERSSGSGEGFFSFSAFVPSQQIVEGIILKQILDDLMTKYLTMLSRAYFTKNVGIDWNFVEQASQELGKQCKHRTKVINTNYTPSDKFAFVNIETEEQVAKYLDKPFQPEYGAFKAVFIGTDLQNPNRQSTHTQLSIDLDNEVYDINWLGDTSDYPFIPRTVRKNQINILECDFPKKHYKREVILLSEGIVDDVNATVTMQVPQLEPIVYSLKFIFNHHEAVKTITATSNTSKTQLVSADNETLEFLGEQVEMQWHIIIQTNDNFLSKEYDIVPSDHIDLNSMKGEYGISLVELKRIKVQIYIDGYEDTKGQLSKVQFTNRITNTIESGRYNKESKCLEFRIPAIEDFDSLYNISLQEAYRNNYELLKESINEHHLLIKISKKIVTSIVVNGGEGNKINNNSKTLKIFVPNKIAQKQIQYSYYGQNYSLNDIAKTSNSQAYTTYTIQVPKSLHRGEITFRINDKQLRSICPEDDHLIIIIKGFNSILDALTYGLGKQKQLIINSLIIFSLIILLAGASIFALSSLGYIEISDRLGSNDTIAMDTEGSDTETINSTMTDSGYSSAYIELNQVLENQKDAWNQEIIYNVVVKYDGEKTLELKSNDSLAYYCLKRLSWLYRTRECINKCDWNALPALVKADNSNFKEKWSLYIDNDKIVNDKITFLRDLINPSNLSARVKLKEKIRKDTAFKNKKYSEIVEIWEACKQNATTQHPSNNNDRNNNNNNNNSNSNSNSGYTDPASI